MYSFGDIRSLLNSERGADGYAEYAPLATALLNYDDEQTPLDVALDYVKRGNNGYVPGCLFQVHGHEKWESSVARCLFRVLRETQGRKTWPEYFIDVKCVNVEMFRISTHSTEFRKAMCLAKLFAIGKYRDEIVATIKDEIDGGDEELILAFLVECAKHLSDSVKYWGGRTHENTAAVNAAAVAANAGGRNWRSALGDLRQAVCANGDQVMFSWLGMVEAVHYAEPFSGVVAEEISRSLERELFKLLR